MDFSAVLLSPLPIEIEALGAPPVDTNAENAVIIIISGIHTPTPQRSTRREHSRPRRLHVERPFHTRLPPRDRRHTQGIRHKEKDGVS